MSRTRRASRLVASGLVAIIALGLTGCGPRATYTSATVTLAIGFAEFPGLYTWSVEGDQVTQLWKPISGEATTVSYTLTDADAYQAALRQALRARGQHACTDASVLEVSAIDENGTTHGPNAMQRCDPTTEVVGDLLDALDAQF